MAVRNSSGQKAVGMFATTVVVFGGLLSCTAIGLSSSDPAPALWICGGCFGGMLLLMWLLRDKPNGESGLLLYAISWLQRGRHRVVRYELKRSPNNPPAIPPQGPPTAEQVRDLTQGGTTWVPSGPGKGKYQPPKRNRDRSTPPPTRRGDAPDDGR